MTEASRGVKGQSHGSSASQAPKNHGSKGRGMTPAGACLRAQQESEIKGQGSYLTAQQGEQTPMVKGGKY